MLYKLDKTGYADEICLDRIGENTDIELSGFTLERFRQMCILSGCDYLDAINGFGLKTCHKYFTKYKTAERVLQAIRAEFPAKVPDDFEAQFAKAELTFCHQRVYDHRCQELVHLYPVTEEMILNESSQQYGNWDFVGPHVESAIAKAIARGEINPITREPFQSLERIVEVVDTQQTVIRSVPSKNKVTGPVKRSRFFKPITKEEHSERMHKRLTIPVDLTATGKENSSPLRLGQARSFSSAVAARKPPPVKRFGTKTTLAQDMAASKIPINLYEASFAAKQPSSSTQKEPVRLHSAQTSLMSFLNK